MNSLLNQLAKSEEIEIPRVHRFPLTEQDVYARPARGIRDDERYQIAKEDEQCDPTGVARIFES